MFLRLEDTEQKLKSNLSLCNETLNMVSYLTSDPDIQKPFLRDELLPRLAEMLLCVLKQLVSVNISGIAQSIGPRNDHDGIFESVFLFVNTSEKEGIVGDHAVNCDVSSLLPIDPQSLDGYHPILSAVGGDIRIVPQ